MLAVKPPARNYLQLFCFEKIWSDSKTEKCMKKALRRGLERFLGAKSGLSPDI